MLEVKRALEKFARNVVKFSRSNLTRKDKNAFGDLYNSLGYDLRVHKNSFSLTFEMEEYGAYQDKGVIGANPSKVSKNAKIRGQQATKKDTNFRFGSRKHSGTWDKFIKSLKKWVALKRVRLRDKKGRFTKGNYTTIAHVIAKNIYNRGIKPSLFFTKPFEASFKHLPDGLVEAYGLTIDNILTK